MSKALKVHPVVYYTVLAQAASLQSFVARQQKQTTGTSAVVNQANNKPLWNRKTFDTAVSTIRVMDAVNKENNILYVELLYRLSTNHVFDHAKEVLKSFPYIF